MKQSITNYIKLTTPLVLAAAIFAGVGVNNTAKASYIPDLSGYVLVQGTNAPVSGVWVKMTNEAGYSRYARTDSSGHYTFEGWTQCDRCNETQLNVPIDTNLDGTNDAVMYQADPNDAVNGNEGSTFSCGRDPFQFTVVRPHNWNGTFSTIGGGNRGGGGCNVCINNSQPSPDVDDLYFTPANTPTPTRRSTATVTPTRPVGVSATPTTSTGSPTPTTASISSCSFSGPASLTVNAGTSRSFSPALTQVNGTVDSVTFTMGDATVSSVCGSRPCPSGSGTYTDNAASFRTDLTGLTPDQSTTLTISGSMTDEGAVCSPLSIPVTVQNVQSWCQFKDTDVITNGSISCRVPPTCASSGTCTNSLITHTTNQSPGVAVASGNIETGAGEVSQSIPPYGWNANTTYNGPSLTYSYFENKARCSALTNLSATSISLADLTAVPVSNGYHWARYTGGVPLTIASDLNVGAEKIVLFVKGDLHINGKINVTRGRGFFMAVVEGNIIVDPNVGGPQESPALADIEGVYFTNGMFKTGTRGPGLDQQLHVRGSIAAFERIVLERSIANNSATPAELFEYAPEFMLLFPSCLGEQNIEWRELAP